MTLSHLSHFSSGQLLPVSIITGFLGAGKTTLLNSLLKDPLLKDAAIIINEFGAISLDHLLVETSDETIMELVSGCLCCAVRGDLIDTITRLLDKRKLGEIKKFNRIIIETTGLADPAPVLQVIIADPFIASLCYIEHVITLVDAVNGQASIAAHNEALKQVALADRIVLTKLDLLTGREGEDQMFALIEQVAKLNPAARLLSTYRGEATAQHLFELTAPLANKPPFDVRKWLGAEALERAPGKLAHKSNIQSFTFVEERAISPAGLELFMDLLRSYHGANMLRMKALVKVSDDPNRPLLLHGVQHIFHPPLRLPHWPDADQHTRMVFIVQNIEKSLIEGLFRAFTDQLSGGASAIMDQTLSLRR